jgi:dipeptide transport system ATP-binding protein
MPRHPYTRALLASTPRIDKAERQTRQVLSGELPSPLNPPSGCAFHKRCPYAVERCTVDVPLLRQPTDGKTIGLVACHFAEEIAARTANPALGTAA